MTAPVEGASRGPIFVVGAMGSGTTVMRLILDSHPDIAIAQETGFARLLLANEWVPFWKFGGEWYQRLGMSREDLDAEQRRFYGELFGRFAERQGARRWGDKTPFHTWHLPLLARIFPDAVFIGTVRHPGAVASSVHNRFKYSWSASVRHWMRSNTELVHRGAQLGDRFALVRFEELVTDPEPLLRELFQWLGEPWDPQVLEFHEVHRARGTAGEAEGGTRSDEPLDTTRIAKWQQTMGPRGHTLLRKETPALAKLLGYDLDDPSTLHPIGRAAALNVMVRGSELAILKQEHADAIDWVHRPVAALENKYLKPEVLKDLKKRAAAATAASGASARQGPAGQLRRRLRRAAKRLPAPVRAPLLRSVAAVKKVTRSRR